MAKGQMRSNREKKKPKKTDADRQKASAIAANPQLARMGQKEPPKKA